MKGLWRQFHSWKAGGNLWGWKCFPQPILSRLYTEVAGCAACQPPGCCIFSQDKRKNLFLHFRHNETGYGGPIEVRKSGLVTQTAKLVLYISTPEKVSKYSRKWNNFNYKTQKLTTFCTEEKERSLLLLLAWREYVHNTLTDMIRTGYSSEGRYLLNNKPLFTPLLKCPWATSHPYHIHYPVELCSWPWLPTSMWKRRSKIFPTGIKKDK